MKTQSKAKARQQEPREGFLDKIEATVIETAASVGMKVRIERETRGRFPTLTLRAVEELGGMDEIILDSRIVDGVKDKQK